uniref:transcription initiation factor TFIID subunit 4-like n=1 Tax=Pristiophorus japonicus TaxID=55135 RepID=UPI00398E92BC
MARPAGQQRPESGGGLLPAPAPSLSAGPNPGPSLRAAAASSLPPPPPPPPAVLTPLANGPLLTPLANGGAHLPPAVPDPGVGSNSSSGGGGAITAVPPPPAISAASASITTTTTSAATTAIASPAPALKVVLLADHVRQNQAGLHPGAGGPPAPPPCPAPAPRAPPAALHRITLTAPPLKAPQTPGQILQNFQVPAGMVLVRSDSGQLVLVPQKAIAQAQAQAKARAQAQGAGIASLAAPTSIPSVRVSTVQATRTQKILNQVKLPSVQQKNQLQTAVQTAAVTQRITVVQPQSAGGAIAAKTVPSIALKQAPGPADRSATVPVTPTAATPETLENVKKCKNFLATLIKLASSGTHSPQMSNNVKALVQKLLDGKVEAEEFTNQLYKELKSSPQPYLVPFLKRSLPALRKLMPNSQAFIQQCLQKPATPVTPLASAPGTSKPPTPGQAPRTITVTSASPQAKLLHTTPSAQMIVQQSGVLVKSQASMLPRTQTVTLQRPPNHLTVPVSQIQVKAVQGGPATSVIKVPLVQGYRNPASVSLQTSPSQKIKREVGGISFRDEDDINDVASMAGVNINEENARILATNSELVGAIIRSCKDEAFLSSVSLQKKALEIGKRHGVTEVNSDVLNTISHATQEHLRELVEKLTVIAQHRMMVYKDDDRYTLLNDTRSQVKFFEQLDRLEKQRKDEDERETMLRLAKSRAKHEDPEQLRLKQRAKEMQQLELAQLQQREANLAALAAIGPRKRKTPDSPGLGTGNEGLSGSGNALGPRATSARPYLRPRVTRVNLRDLLLCLEQERARHHSLLLYRAYLK